MNEITTAGIDLAKTVFSLHGVDGLGKVMLRRSVRRDQLEETVAKLPPCLIGMEACSGAHEWARRFRGYGHTVKLTQGMSEVAVTLGSAMSEKSR